MISAHSERPRYRTRFSAGREVSFADTTADKGGGGCGFRPHDLLEAALATCVNVFLRMYAEHHGIPLEGVTSAVTLDRANPEETVFRYSIQLGGAALSAEQREKLLQAAQACPVRRTLSKKIRFESQ